MKKVYQSIEKLLDYAQKYLLLDGRDRDYTRNNIYALFGLNAYMDESGATEETVPDKLLEEFTAACVECDLFPIAEKAYWCDRVMGILSPLPSVVEKEFYKIVKVSGAKAACEWFYDFSVKSDYVKKSVLDKNSRFEQDGLVITINKAKPEFRDPKKAASGNTSGSGYPKCNICHENEGFAGRNKCTLRTIDMDLNGTKFFWQFSPYGYFFQHGIAINYEHTPMHVEKHTFERLMDFVEMFPNWFLGCNAPLPRIGGSVLAHDHYQGGGEVLPLMKAKAAFTLHSKDHPDTIVEVLDWSGTVVRVVSKDRKSVSDISESIRKKWINYTDKSIGIIANDENGQYNAISPTVLKTERGYEMSIILRSNITSEKYPDGVFHAHPEFHIIKKESIGLIEAQGLFILPGRLETELGEIEGYIVNNQSLPHTMSEFTMIFEETKALCKGDLSAENVHNAMRAELVSVCNRILENTAVFKDKMQTVTFMQDLGFEL